MTSLSTLSLERLREIYTNTFGIFPASSATKEWIISVLNKEIKFGREIKY